MALRLAKRLEHLFSQTIDITSWNGQDHYGQTEGGITKTYKARIERGVMRTTGPNKILVSTHKIILAEAVQVDPRDIITLPAAYGSRNDEGKMESPQASILEVQHLSDSEGHVSTVLHCGRGANGN